MSPLQGFVWWGGTSQPRAHALGYQIRSSPDLYKAFCLIFEFLSQPLQFSSPSTSQSSSSQYSTSEATPEDYQ